MTNEIAKAAAADQAAIAALKKRAQSAKAKGAVPQVGGAFIKMTKRGIWVFGQDNIEVQEGSLWAVNPGSMMSGLVCWTRYPEESKKKDEKLGEVMVPMGHDAPLPEDMEVHRDETLNRTWSWEPIMEVEMVCVTGEDAGTKVKYTTSSKGGLGLLNEWFDKMLAELDNGTPVAVIELSARFYDHTKWGETAAPVFEYDSWRAITDTAVEAEPEAEDEPEAIEEKAQEETKPAPRRRRAAAKAEPEAAEEAEPEGDAPAPTRRRRRPAA